MNTPQQQFLALLRSGLWGIPADPALFPGQADWEAIVAHSVSQAVPALVAEGAHVPVDEPPAGSPAARVRAAGLDGVGRLYIYGRSASDN